ncbi:ribonuclease H-like domain-containing protein [Halalkalibacter urbisdiaboli]|uniref:ribonuclease H-like domain-containing protein n=1 Tax=Halalkalibacter urbisdiaboli TaxID=1960589 RepID=UPI000B43DCE3|nr:ribonuclease H-like domain-containing protein [Halalkalibacter urbisdiaboli]
MALKGKLNRLKQHMNFERGEHVPSKPVVDEQEGENTIPYLEKWSSFGAKPVWFEGQYTMIRDVHYPLEHQHGRYRFFEIKKAIKQWQDHVENHPLSAKARKPEDLLFFDTETTGLSSGAGNTIFLLGYSQIRENDVRVRQYFLPGPEAEVSLYHHFLTDVGQMKNLVTYNGKSFDWPQVKTRHTFVREQVPQLPRFGHFDLLHASRRLWKEMLPSCKLSVVESNILGFERKDDTPSYLVPMLYFDFVNERDPSFVEGVLKHHEWDVLSLVTLYTHLSLLITDREKASLHPRELFEIARWYEYLGEKEIASNLYEQLIVLGESVSYDGLFYYAGLLKQKKLIRQALQAYEDLLQANRYPVESAIECSKIYEHGLKDIEKALFFAKCALVIYKERSALIKGKKEKLVADLEKRINRLERKIKGA